MMRALALNPEVLPFDDLVAGIYGVEAAKLADMFCSLATEGEGMAVPPIKHNCAS